jgi:putative glycosyltransferase (TIGR04372 family)
MFKGAENHIAGMKTHDYNATIMECLPIIKFSKAQEKKAKEMLKSFGVNKDFVSINARDNAYKSRLSKIYNQDVYSEKRNTDLSTYYKASRWLSKQNIGLIRIGYKVEFKTTEPCIFDYSSINLSVPSRELMDLYIQSKSQFVLIGDSGLANVSRMFRVPSLAVNLPTPIFTLNNYAPDSIFITQKYFSNKLGRNLTYAELFSTFEGEKEVEFINKLIERFDVVFIKNTEEDIFLATQEMYHKLTNQWKFQDDEKELQEKFWNIFEQNMPLVPNYDNYIYNFLYGRSLKDYRKILFKKMNITIAYSFIKNNIELMG